jgi:programmed cell death 6-interacting protein
MFADIVARAEKALAESKKDNDFIYHERVPDVNMLTPISKASLAKVIQPQEKLSSNFKGSHITGGNVCI